MNKELRQAVYEKYIGRCAYCGEKIEFKDMQVDHFIPQRLGGTDDIDNLMPSCRLCNHYKRANKIETFRNMIEKIPEKLHSNYIYKVGLAYKNVSECPRDIRFYFENFDRMIRMAKENTSTNLESESYLYGNDKEPEDEQDD